MTHALPAGPWRTIVVDDEPLARQTLRVLLSREPDFAVVAECSHGADAVDAIRGERPDVVFLDVQMPEVDGFEVPAAARSGSVPAVIFVTAFDGYALQAFEQHALDYLLKPFSDERFAVVLDRTRVRLREHSFASMAGAAAGSALGDGAGAQTARRSRRRPHLRDPARRHRLDRSRGLLRAHPHARPHDAGPRLAARAGRFAGAHGFVRAHRSAIVNIAHVREIEPLTSGDQRLTLSDGTTVKVSRTYRASVIDAIAHR